MYTKEQRKKRQAILSRDKNTCFYCGLTAHQIEWTDTDPEGAISTCRDCISIIQATWFLKDVSPPDRRDFLHCLRNEKKIQARDERFSSRPKDAPRLTYTPPKKTHKSRLRQKLAQRYRGVV